MLSSNFRNLVFLLISSFHTDGIAYFRSNLHDHGSSTLPTDGQDRQIDSQTDNISIAIPFLALRASRCKKFCWFNLADDKTA